MGYKDSGQPDLGLEDLYPGLHRAAQLTCYTEVQNSLIGGRSWAVSTGGWGGDCRKTPWHGSKGAVGLDPWAASSGQRC